VVLTLAATLAPASARAELWSLESSLQAGLETNDNVSLTVNPAGTVNTRSLSASLDAARSAENASTRLNAVLSLLQQRGPGADDRVDGRLGLTQTLNYPRNSLTLSASLAQDFNDEVISADVTVGRGQRRTASLSGGWSYSLSERLSVSAQLSASRVGYGEELTRATDYRTTGASASLSYRVSDVDTVTSKATRSDYETLSGSNRSSTDSIDFGFSRALSERTSGSFYAGVYRTTSSFLVPRIGCPLPVNLCQAGLVAWIIFPERFETLREGWQLNASLSHQFDEITGVSASLARQPSPSGSGSVVLSDTLSISGSRALSPTLSMSAGLAASRSSRLTPGQVQPNQRSLSASMSKQFSPDLRLQAVYRFTTEDVRAGGISASSNSFGVALSYDWAKLAASH
jgi:hypothetical protein